MAIGYFDLSSDFRKDIFLKHLKEYPIGTEIASTVKIDTTNPISLSNKTKQNNIVMMDATTNQAIEHYTHLGYKVAALNFANAYTVGGGVLHGASAQEEEICITSPMLYNSMMQFAVSGNKYYNTKVKHAWTKKILYSDDVLIRYDGGHNNYQEFAQPYRSSFITAAAPKLNSTKVVYNQQLKNTLKPELERMIKYIYMAPLISNNLINLKNPTFKNSLWKPNMPHNKFQDIDVLILGAWGCGAFAPNGTIISPEGTDYRNFIANLFLTVLNTIDSKYKIVCFAIMKAGKVNNYDIFKNVLQCKEEPLNNPQRQYKQINVSVPKKIVNHFIKPIKKSTKKFIRKPIKRSIKKFIRKPIKKLSKKSIKKLSKKSIKKLIRKIKKSTKKHLSIKRKLFI